MNLRKFLSLLVVLDIAIWGLLFVVFGIWEKRVQLSNVPDAFGVSRIIYEAEESWGFGPGGNETGLIVYELPQSTAIRIIEGGMSYLDSTRQRYDFGKDWHGHYETWLQTPVRLEGDDGGPSRTNDHEIAHYLDRYGFGITILPEIEREIDEALSKPGCYLSYGRIGFILVIPKTKKVVYAYNG